MLRGAYLVRADLSDAVLRNAVLNGAELEGAHLSDADLRGCDLTHVHFDKTRVGGIDLRGAAGFWGGREHEIDVAEDDAPELLNGRAAREWLLGRIHPARGAT